jgi:allantoin racemase
VDEVLAAPGVVDAAIKAEADGAEAVVIDCMLDPGLDAAREAVSIPVIGCGEAAMRATGAPFAVVTAQLESAFRCLRWRPTE